MLVTREKPIRDFTSLYRTRNTSQTYAGAIRRFMAFIYGAPSEIADYEHLAARYLRDGDRNCVYDLLQFVRWESDNDVVPCTARVHIAGVQQWLIENDVSFTEKDRQRLRRISPRGGRRTNIKFVDTIALREIVAVLDPRMRAFVLVAACTGMRISEVLALVWSRVSFPDRQKMGQSEKLAEIYISDSKNQSARRVWITREAEDALMVWRGRIPEYKHKSAKASKNLGIVSQNAIPDRVFPFTVYSVYSAWNRALEEVGRYSKDPVTGRVQMNVHRLRGFFKTQTMPLVGGEMSELMMGHCDAYGHAYNGLPDHQMEKLFQKCEGALTVAPNYAVSGAMALQNEEMHRMSAELDELRGFVDRLSRDGGANMPVLRSRGVG